VEVWFQYFVFLGKRVNPRLGCEQATLFFFGEGPMVGSGFGTTKKKAWEKGRRNKICGVGGITEKDKQIE